MHVDETYWSIRWSTCTGLVPELPMIPDRSVFLCAPQGRSLTATVKGITGLLLSFSKGNVVAPLVSARQGGGVEDYDCSPKIAQGLTKKQQGFTKKQRGVSRKEISSL